MRMRAKGRNDWMIDTHAYSSLQCDSRKLFSTPTGAPAARYAFDHRWERIRAGMAIFHTNPDHDDDEGGVGGVSRSEQELIRRVVSGYASRGPCRLLGSKMYKGE